VLEFELSASCLLGRCSTTWSAHNSMPWSSEIRDHPGCWQLGERSLCMPASFPGKGWVRTGRQCIFPKSTLICTLKEEEVEFKISSPFWSDLSKTATMTNTYGAFTGSQMLWGSSCLTWIQGR
jgi:hypothetical protein